VGSDLPAEDRAESDERDDGPVQVGERGEDDRGGGVGCRDRDVLYRVDHL